jgi:hypothetical protein
LAAPSDDHHSLVLLFGQLSSKETNELRSRECVTKRSETTRVVDVVAD